MRSLPRTLVLDLTFGCYTMLLTSSSRTSTDFMKSFGYYLKFTVVKCDGHVVAYWRIGLATQVRISLL